MAPVHGAHNLDDLTMNYIGEITNLIFIKKNIKNYYFIPKNELLVGNYKIGQRTSSQYTIRWLMINPDFVFQSKKKALVGNYIISSNYFT